MEGVGAFKKGRGGGAGIPLQTLIQNETFKQLCQIRHVIAHASTQA